MDINPAVLDFSKRYRLLIGCIVPRPIAVISTISPDGKKNLAPYSFFSGVGSEPMSLLFCPANKPDGSEKDTLRNCKPIDEGGIGEFVVNVALTEYQREVAAAGEPLPYGESEFDLTGLGTTSSRIVRPPRLAESPIAFECKTMQVLRLKPNVPGGANVVIGEIVHIYVQDHLIDEDLHVLPDRLQTIGRLGGLSYCTTKDRFDLPRGRAALDPTEK